MKTAVVIAISLLVISCSNTSAGDKKKARARKLVVDGTYYVRKDFSAFEDIYPRKTREAVLKKFTPDGGGVLWFDVYDLGPIKITSGKIAAFDPVVFMGGAFAKRVPNGKYPVLLAVEMRRDPAVMGKLASPPWPFVVFARVELADRPAVRWELALFEDDKLNEKDSRKLTGYGVDSGMGAFADARSKTLIQKVHDTAMSDEITKRVERFHGARAGAPAWAKVKYGEAEMIRFGSFGGDGQYASYWGYDKDNNVVALMTDFGWRDWVGKPKRKK